MRYTPYIPKYFRPEELMPKDPTIDKNAWMYVLDGKMLRILDLLRERFGKITINNWYWGGKVQFAGYRPPDCKEGSVTSQHRFGRAFDLKFEPKVNLEDVIGWILLEHPEVTCIRKYEWGLHIDSRNVIGDTVVWKETA